MRQPEELEGRSYVIYAWERTSAGSDVTRRMLVRSSERIELSRKLLKGLPTPPPATRQKRSESD